MSDESKPASTPANRRGSQRLPVRGGVNIECRKGSLGLGQNLAVSAVNLSEIGVKLVLKTELPKGQEVELSFQGAGPPVKRIAKLVWLRPLPDGMHEAAFRFDANISYADYQRFTQPRRIIGSV